MLATKYYQNQGTPSTVATFESGGVPRKYSSMSSGTNSIVSKNNNSQYYQATSCPSTPRVGFSTTTTTIATNCNGFSCPTSPFGTPHSNYMPPLSPSRSVGTPHTNCPSYSSHSNAPTFLSLAPRSTPTTYHYNSMQQQQRQPENAQKHRRDNSSSSISNNSSNENHQRPSAKPTSTIISSTEYPGSPSKKEFVKSQAELNRSYWQRRARINQAPVAARMITGMNLKNLQPLAIRTAIFC